MSKPWYVFDNENESLAECRDRRLRQCPLLTGTELEALRQLRTATWDGNLISKTARSELVHRGFAVKWNGWQVISAEGLAILETLGELKA